MGRRAPVVGAVLAGGAGRRLGGAKPGAMLAGRPLLEYPLAALRAELEEVAIVAKAGTPLPGLVPEVFVWLEPDEPRHPLAGVVEALRRAGGRPVVVLACDLPLVTGALVRDLLAVDAGGAPAVVARADGRLQPLCARYEPQALDRLSRFDPGGRVVEQVQALGPALLDVDAALLRNVNDAAQLAEVEAMLRGGRSSGGPPARGSHDHLI